jgi:hypothetical protein
MKATHQNETEETYSTRDKHIHRRSMSFGIDLRKIDKGELRRGEKDIYGVYIADLQRNDIDPAPLIVGLMHGIQQKYGDGSTPEAEDFTVENADRV